MIQIETVEIRRLKVISQFIWRRKSPVLATGLEIVL